MPRVKAYKESIMCKIRFLTAYALGFVLMRFGRMEDKNDFQ